jgi:small redox-active disulfide protein 2
MVIKILGTGCARCHQLEKNVLEVVKDLGIDAKVEDVTNMNQIMKYPILMTPGLVIDEKLVCSGRVPTKTEVTTLITTAMANQNKAG